MFVAPLPATGVDDRAQRALVDDALEFIAPVQPQRAREREDEQRVGRDQHVVRDQAGNDRADRGDRHGHAQQAECRLEINQPPAVVADETRQEAESLRDQRGADRCERGVEHVLGTEKREHQYEDRREQRRAADAAQHGAGRDADCDREHEPVKREIHSVSPRRPFASALDRGGRRGHYNESDDAGASAAVGQCQARECNDAMKPSDIRELLARLGRELHRADDADFDAGAEMHELHRRVERIESDGGNEVEFLLDRVKRLESQFAAEHPTIARVARDLADALAKMGI